MAEKMISELVPADALAGDEEFPVSQDGLTRRATVTQLAEVAPAGPQGEPGPPGPPGADSTVPGPTGPVGPPGAGLAAGGITDQILVKASNTDFDTKWAPEPLHWHGAWTPGTYNFNSMVRDDRWTAVVVNPAGTDDMPSPQRSGTDAWFLAETPTWESITSNASLLTVILRYTAAQPGWITAVRYWNHPVANLSVDVGLRTAPESTNMRTLWLLEDQDADLSGGEYWREVIIREPAIALPGDVFDVVCVIHNKTVYTDNAANYDYVKLVNPQTPVSGQIVHSGKEADILRIHKTDNDGTDRTSLLAATVPGSDISVTGQTWTVSDVADQGTWIDFFVTPATQAGTAGVQSVQFRTYGPAPTDYRKLTDFYLDKPEAQSLVQIDDGPATTYEHAYGVDLKFEPATMSPDWEIIAYSGAT